MQNLEQVALQSSGIRKFSYGDRMIAASIDDELDFVVKNHAELFLAKVKQYSGQRGAILSCIGEHGVIIQFQHENVDGFAEDELAFKIRYEIKSHNPETQCVVVHIGRDAQSSVKIIETLDLCRYILMRQQQFGTQNITINTTD